MLVNPSVNWRQRAEAPLHLKHVASFVLDVHLLLQHLILHKMHRLWMLRFPRLHLRTQHAHRGSELLLGRHGISSAQCQCSKRRYHARWLWCVRACFLSHIEGSHQFDGVTSVKERSTQEDTTEQKNWSLHNRKIHLRGEGTYSASGPLSNVLTNRSPTTGVTSEVVGTFLPARTTVNFWKMPSQKTKLHCSEKHKVPTRRRHARMYWWILSSNFNETSSVTRASACTT